MRQLLAHERALVSHLFKVAGLPFDPEALIVKPMSDGGMGSLALGTDYESRRMGQQVAECHFVDKDQVLVSATLNVDTEGEPYEVDMWKVNFEPTVEWPASAEIRSGPPNKSLERTRER
jgi:hypothetical protein